MRKSMEEKDSAPHVDTLGVPTDEATGGQNQRTPSMLPQSFFPRCGCTLSTDDGRRVYVCHRHAREGLL
jgi:hypothetical protein